MSAHQCLIVLSVLLLCACKAEPSDSQSNSGTSTQTQQDSGTNTPQAGGPNANGGASGSAGATNVGGPADASAPLGGQVPPCGACLFDEACLGEQVCARLEAGDETGVCVRDTGVTECCLQDGNVSLCFDIPATWSDSYRCPAAEPEVGAACERQEACVFGTDTAPVLCDCNAGAWECMTCPATAPAPDESCAACVGCQQEALACDFVEDICTCEGDTWSCVDQRTSAEWEMALRAQVEALRAEIGCTEPAQQNPHATGAALAVAEGFDANGEPPPSPLPGIDTGASWYMSLVEDPEQVELSLALRDYLDVGAPCTGVSLGIAITGVPGETRRVVLLMSECLDCGASCGADCG